MKMGEENKICCFTRSVACIAKQGKHLEKSVLSLNNFYSVLDRI